MKTYKSIAEFNTALMNLKVTLPASIVVGTRSASAKLARRIRKRVSELGVSSNFDSFSPYSARHIKEKRTRGHGALGQQSSFKNFYWTGQFWNSFAVQSVKLQGNTINAGIDFAGENTEISNKAILLWQDRYEHKSATIDSNQSLADPNEIEIDKMVKDIEYEVFMTIQKSLGTLTLPVIP